MAKKIISSRIAHKHDSEANWLKATNFAPMKGELIIYDPDSTYDYARFKIGDGTTNINTLPFATDKITDYIKSGSQTTTSSADGGSNVYTFTSADGTASTFTVKNGSKGSTGATGSVASITTEGSGNAITAITLNDDKTVTAVRGTSFLLASDHAYLAKLNTENTFTQKNSFSGGLETTGAQHGINMQGSTWTYVSSGGSKTITVPWETGTLALTKDIPDTSNFVDKTSEQTIDGAKRFDGSVAFGTDVTFEDVLYNGNGDEFYMPQGGGTLATTNDIRKKITLAELRTMLTNNTANYGKIIQFVPKKALSTATYTGWPGVIQAVGIATIIYGQSNISKYTSRTTIGNSLISTNDYGLYVTSSNAYFKYNVSEYDHSGGATNLDITNWTLNITDSDFDIYVIGG